ncbi:MAG: hypothetical protein GX660_15565 [Clostridiaceae bacterium]|nr:hypothetical protein [Clostridiaceae bacterium]
MKRDLKINFSVLEELIREIKKYRSALVEMERASSKMIGILEENISEATDELLKMYKDFTSQIKGCSEE